MKKYKAISKIFSPRKWLVESPYINSNPNFAILSHTKPSRQILHFSEYLKQCREHSHLTQERLTSDLYSFDIDTFEGIQTTTISKWEREITQPKLSKQISIIKYFQQKTGTALPCWENYTVEEAEELICREGIHNLLGKSKKYIYDFPSEMLSVDDMKVYPLRNSERMDALLDANMLVHQSFNHPYTQISRQQFREWAFHPESLFLACEYKDNFLGLFFSIRVKPEVFEKILNFKMKKSDIAENDFASSDEPGSNLMLSFFALNEKVAILLFVRYYAYLITNQKVIDEIGGVTIQDEAKKIVANMNLDYADSKVTDDNVEIEAYRQTLPNLLASENSVKMLLSKGECPEE